MNPGKRLATVLLATLTLGAFGTPALADNTTLQPFKSAPALGGGYIGTGASFAAPTQTIVIRVAADRRQLNIHGVLDIDCEDATSYAASSDGYNVPLAADGTFAGSVPYERSASGSSRSGTFSYSGKVTPAGVAIGNARLTMTASREGSAPVPCTTGAFKWTARDPASKPGSGTLLKKAAFYGVTDEARAVGFRVRRDSKTVSSFIFDQRFDSEQCSVGGPIVAPSNITLVNLKIKNGKFSGKPTIDRSFGDTDVRYEFRVAGKFGAARASGTLSFRITGTRGGSVISRCESGQLTWRAER